jgi:L-ascorbate metabolism protein UlaG (beta-lactamase superfamily)
MEIRRTATAGILVTMDSVQILLDGVCREVLPYLATPSEERQRLASSWPNAVCFTHTHEDHFCPDFAAAYKAATGREVIIPSGEGEWIAGNVRINAIPTRHLGKAGGNTAHCSFVIQGSKTLWVMGDAAPTQLRKLEHLPKPDVLMVPFAYLATESALALVQQYLPCKLILVHMPLPDNDPDGIWDAVKAGMAQCKEFLHVPAVGETITL